MIKLEPFPERIYVTVALKATEQLARRAAHNSKVIAAPIRNACAFLANNF